MLTSIFLVSCCRNFSGDESFISDGFEDIPTRDAEKRAPFNDSTCSKSSKL